MLTAKDGEWDEAEALDAGADDYLTKPFSYVVLQAHLRALVRRGAKSVALLVGALVWALTGWALRPVDVIRADVDELSATDLRRRVPEPAVNDEIGRLARTMNAMLKRLEASNDRQRQLVADVSHELRNPLASLQAQLEVATAHPGTTGEANPDGAGSLRPRLEPREVKAVPPVTSVATSPTDGRGF